MAIKQFNSIAGYSIGGDPSPITVVDSNANVTANTLVVNTNASIAGNITVGNANLGNLVTANFFQGDGGLLTNIAVSSGTAIINGTSNVSVGLNGNVTIGINGNSNVLVVTSTSANIAGTVNITGNIIVGAVTYLNTDGTSGQVLTTYGNGATYWSSTSGSMVYPNAGIAVSTGSAWGTSLTAPSGTIVGTTDTQTLSNKTITGTKETVYTITDGTSVDIDPSNGGIQTWTLGASRSPTATNFRAGQSVTLMIDDGSAYTVTWPSVTWLDGASAPTLQTTGYTIIELFKIGTTIYGMGRR